MRGRVKVNQKAKAKVNSFHSCSTDTHSLNCTTIIHNLFHIHNCFSFDFCSDRNLCLRCESVGTCFYALIDLEMIRFMYLIFVLSFPSHINSFHSFFIPFRFFSYSSIIKHQLPHHTLQSQQHDRTRTSRRDLGQVSPVPSSNPFIRNHEPSIKGMEKNHHFNANTVPGNRLVFKRCIFTSTCK